MSKGTVGSRSPRGLLRLGLRLPILLYRARLGWLLGKRFLMLTHIGRKSGQPHQTVVEVVDHDAATGTYFIASGWGRKSDWFRNVQKTPEVTVHVGGRRFEAVAECIPLDAAEQRLQVYARKHPLAFRELTRVMLGESLTGTPEDCRRLANSVPVVALARVAGGSA